MKGNSETVARRTLSFVHLEDDPRDQEAVRALSGPLAARLATFLRENYPRSEGPQAADVYGLECYQAGSVAQLLETLRTPVEDTDRNAPSPPLTVGDTCAFFLLDMLVPAAPGEPPQSLGSHTVRLDADDPESAVPLHAWLRTYYPTTPCLVLTTLPAGDDQVREFVRAHLGEVSWTPYLQKDLVRSPTDWLNELQARFAAWWQPEFWRRLQDYAGAEGAASWHTPGHNLGNAFDRSPLLNMSDPDRYGRFLFRTDLSVSVDRLGDLSEPDAFAPRARRSPLGAAQRRSAEIFGAHETLYVTNGTSTSNKALLMTLLRPGEVVLLDRNCHKSVHQAVVMSGALPLYMTPRFNRRLGVWTPLPLHEIARALAREYPEDLKPRVLALTTCTYEGLLYPIDRVSELCEEQGVLLLADEAWAPYLRFHPEYVRQGRARRYNAADGGAHVCVHSTHKALAAFSQASMIHVSQRLVELLDARPGPAGTDRWAWLRQRYQLDGQGSYARLRHDLIETLRFWHSTSPLYPMLATLELSGLQMRLEGRRLLAQRLHWVERLRADLGRHGLGDCLLDLEQVVGEDEAAAYREAGYRKDPLKLLVGVAPGDDAVVALKGALLERRLQWEKSAHGCVEFLVTIGTFWGHLCALGDALIANRRLVGRPRVTSEHLDSELARGQVVVLPREAELSDSELVPIDALDPWDDGLGPTARNPGRVSAQMVVPYPPGIPLLLPGLPIRAAALESLRTTLGGGHGDVHGIFARDGRVYVRVMSHDAVRRSAEGPTGERIRRLRRFLERDET